MAPRNVRLVWGTPPVSAGRWHGGLVNLKVIPSGPQLSAASPDPWHEYRRHRLHLSMRGLLLWGLALALVVHLAAAAVLHHRLENADPYNRVGFLDLALPTRWSGLDRLRGRALIDQGRALLEKGRFNEGLTLLRLGLSRQPANHEARLALARIYAVLRLRPQAEKLLREGLDHGYPGRESLELTLSLAADSDHPARWLELCQLARVRLDALSVDARPTKDSLWLDQETVRALLASKRLAEALALVETRYPETHPFRREITLLHLLETGRAAEAAVLAADWAEQSPRAPEPLRLLARACRQAGDHAATDTALTRLRALDPVRPDALLYALAQHHLAARAEAARTVLDSLLLRHGADPGLYPALAAVLVEFRDLPALDRLAAELRERGLPLRPVDWARLQLDVAKHDWPLVLVRAKTLRTSPGPDLTEAQGTWLETATRLAGACLDGASGTQASLVEFVADHPGALRLYASLIDALLKAGRPATARQVLALAEGPFPASVTLADLRPRIEAALAPAPATPADAATGPAFVSADDFVHAFSDRIRGNDTDGALALLASVRRARPGWLGEADPRLDALELPLRARGDDPLRLQLLARGALARDDQASAKLLALAREIEAEDSRHRAHGLLLVKEILRHDAGHAEALRQLLAWEPRPARPPVDPEL